MDTNMIADEIRVLTEDAVLFAKGSEDEGLPKAAHYLHEGKIAETLRECSAILGRDSHHALARLYAGIALYKRGDLKKAGQQFQVFLKSPPDAPLIVRRVRNLANLFAGQLEDGAESHPTGDAPAEEMGSILRVGYRGRSPGSVLNINWVITSHCNFTCSYCTVYNNASGYPPLALLIEAADKIAALGRPDVKIVLSGGEPTVHPGYIDFAVHLAENISNLSTLRTETNLSRTPRFYRDLMDRMAAHADLLQFDASIHFEFTEIDRFLDNARFLADQGTTVQIRLLAHPERMAEVRQIAHELVQYRNENLRFIVKTIRKQFGREVDDRYTAEDLTWLAEVYDAEEIERSIVVDFLHDGVDAPGIERRDFAPNELIARKLNRFKGMGCYAGVEMISIDSGGWLDRAVCFRSHRMAKPNIFRDAEIPKALLQPVICPFDYCSCPEDIAISKFALRKSKET